MRPLVIALATLAVGGAAATGVAAAQTAPSADELTGKLQRALNTSLSADERASELEGGSAAVATADNIAAVMDRYGSMMSWRVQNATQNGDQVDAQLAVTVPLFGTRTHQIYWVNRDGAWKLSNPSACVIARDAAGAACTV
ncbi:hypothetical protein NIIDNTM18_13240 [Mycolicibacterium litorale]|uniref:Low molecular weight antigen MTB12-like C-terminal domain-containing protein n=1 Tax=Mycolicibacterium litorale TaxID=758802 RepID=A0A6S6P232_9MYCO|nr:hypothetical protein [Mycolicibacterium litorale]BCI52046.1 hypothetical protein NIIDNTM18_13240 [Mycolicibacterium litorale]